MQLERQSKIKAIAQVFLVDGSFRFSRRSGSRVSIYPDIRRLRVLPVNTEVSWVILCPLAQPNKAIGLESQIGSWLAC